MAGVDDRIAEAEAALVTLDEAIGKSTSSLLERDGAILRLIYTFEAVWKASQQLLAEHAKRHDPRGTAGWLALGRGCTGCFRYRQ